MKFPSIQELYSVFIKNPVIATDSRKIPSGSIFFALKGESFDGNKFAESALKEGARYSVVDDAGQYKEGNYILVTDCLKALQELAVYHRSQLKIPFIAITGSNGKTTTKELAREVLSKKYKTLATQGNLNNHIGVPLTILSVSSEIEVAIIEMGANHVGEISALCEIGQPDYALITNIGKAHIGEFGSFENIVKAKTEMYGFIRKRNGKAFVCSDNELLMKKSDGIERITYGISDDNYCSCRFEGSDPFLSVKFENEIITTQLVGKYNFENVSSAICIGKYFGVERGKIKSAIEEYSPSNNRSQVLRTQSNTIVMDAYNANPSSMRAAIENFYEMAGKSKWLILGDMRELGSYEVEEHKNIVKLIKEKNFDKVLLVGDVFSKAASELKCNFPLYKTSDELINALKSKSPVVHNSLILVKGSRGIKLERVAEWL